MNIINVQQIELYLDYPQFLITLCVDWEIVRVCYDYVAGEIIEIDIPYYFPEDRRKEWYYSIEKYLKSLVGLNDMDDVVNDVVKELISE